MEIRSLERWSVYRWNGLPPKLRPIIGQPSLLQGKQVRNGGSQLRTGYIDNSKNVAG
jgi:hypothetical protein